MLVLTSDKMHESLTVSRSNANDADKMKTYNILTYVTMVFFDFLKELPDAKVQLLQNWL